MREISTNQKKVKSKDLLEVLFVLFSCLFLLTSIIAMLAQYFKYLPRLNSDLDITSEEAISARIQPVARSNFEEKLSNPVQK